MEELRYFSGKIIILILFILATVVINGQDRELLKQYTWKQFDITSICQITVDYQTDNFSFLPVNKKESSGDIPSLRKINKLKDSLRITDDIYYLKEIGLMYFALNKKDSGRFYLYEAENRYWDKLKNNPKDSSLLQDICMINYSLGNIQQAMDFADSILKIYPFNLNALNINILLHTFTGDFEGARTYYEKVIEHFPENPLGYLQKTNAILLEETYKLAGKTKENFTGIHYDISFLQEAAEIYACCPEIQMATLSCKLLLLFYGITIPIGFDPPESMKNFKIPLTKNDSLELASYEKQYFNMIEDSAYINHYTLYYSLGIINFLKGNYFNAIACFEKSIELCGSRNEGSISSCYDNISTCYLYLGDTLNAKNNIEMKIKNVNSSSVKATGYIQIGTYEVSEKHLRRGYKCFKKALELDSNAYKAYVDLANLQMLKNNLDLAQEYIDKCYSIKPDCLELYKSFILLSLFQGDTEMAEYFVNRCLSNDPEDTFAQDIKRDFLK